MRKLISVLNPIYWTTAREIGEAVNGYTLTDGIFRRETQVEFATGESNQDRCSNHRVGSPRNNSDISQLTH